MASYDVGDRARLTAEFRDLDGQPLDPSAVRCIVRHPEGEPATHEYPGAVVREAAGDYALEVDLTAPGVWWVRWESEGLGRAAEETSLTVRASWFV